MTRSPIDRQPVPRRRAPTSRPPAARAPAADQPPVPRRRADAKQETRDALVAAALAEFAEHGLDAPSLDAICARAGYTRGAFYVHFRDRDDLLIAVVQHAMAAFLDEVIAAGDEAHDLERTIGRFAEAVARSVEAARSGGRPAIPLPATVPFARVLEAVSRMPALREGFRALLAHAAARLHAITARGQEAGAVRRDVDGDAVATLLVIVALGVLVALDVGVPLDAAGLHAAVLTLVAARRTASVDGAAPAGSVSEPPVGGAPETRAPRRRASRRRRG